MGVEVWSQFASCVCVSHHALEKKPWANDKAWFWKTEGVRWHSQKIGVAASCSFWVMDFLDNFLMVGELDWWKKWTFPEFCLVVIKSVEFDLRVKYDQHLMTELFISNYKQFVVDCLFDFLLWERGSVQIQLWKVELFIKKLKERFKTKHSIWRTKCCFQWRLTIYEEWFQQIGMQRCKFWKNSSQMKKSFWALRLKNWVLKISLTLLQVSCRCGTFEDWHKKKRKREVEPTSMISAHLKIRN